jgi:hypothetical protein
VRERELRGEVPPGDVDVRAGAPDLSCDLGEGVLAVDQDLERVPRPRWRLSLDPEAGIGWRREGGRVTEPVQPPFVMITNEAFEAGTQGSIRSVNQVRHGHCLAGAISDG